jgi:hypothetical protein
MSDAAHLLEVLRDAAGRGEDLAVALRSSGLPGSERAAERLVAGATLPQAVADLIPARLASLLAGGVPPLSTVCALLADEAWRQTERRHMVVDHLAYPLASCCVIGILALVIQRVLPAGAWYGSAISLGWVLPPALGAVLLGVAPWTPRRWRLPGSSWAWHLDLASRWARAALALHWRLTEEQALRLLGVDLAPMAVVLGTPGAEEHCRMLADWHRRAARRHLTITAYLAAALVLVAGGALVLNSMRMWMATPV